MMTQTDQPRSIAINLTKWLCVNHVHVAIKLRSQSTLKSLNTKCMSLSTVSFHYDYSRSLSFSQSSMH